MAKELAAWVDESEDFERLAPVPFSTVCFRAYPQDLRERAGTEISQMDVDAYLNLLNERMMEDVNHRGKVFLSHTKLNGKFTLRLAIGNIRTTRDHVRLAWDELNTARERLDEKIRPVELRG
jgi:aromatic-L-amino-acid decarboxylase